METDVSSLVRVLRASLKVPSGTRVAHLPQQIELAAEAVQATVHALLERGYSQLLTFELWHPKRTNGMLIISRDWVKEAIVALRTPREGRKEPKPARICAAELLYSFVATSMKRTIEIPAAIFCDYVVQHLGNFRDGAIATILVQAVGLENKRRKKPVQKVPAEPPVRIILTRRQIHKIVDFLDPDGARERAKGRQTAAVAISEKLHKHTREQRGRTIKIPPELVRLTLLYLPERGYAWLEKKLKHLDRRGRVRMTRPQVYDLCDALDSAGINRRKRASRRAWEERHRSGNGKGRRRRGGPRQKPKVKGGKGSPSQLSRRASHTRERLETGR